MNKVYCSKGEVLLGKKLGEGGEAIIYEIINDKLHCVKIYKKPSELYHKKILIMSQNPPEDPTIKQYNHTSIAWPLTPLYLDKSKNKFIGYIMTKIDTNKFVEIHKCFSSRDRNKEFGVNFNWKNLYIIALNIASAVSAIHKKGYCIGDINSRNILISRESLITLIDCDSYQIQDPVTKKIYICPVGTPEYTPPELIGKSFKNEIRTQETDNFSLAILLFQVLMLGFHPFQGIYQGGKDEISLEEKIKRGLFAYKKDSTLIIPPKDAPPFEILPTSIQKLFYESFVEGSKIPSKRPTSFKYFMELKNNFNNIKKCEIYENHFYSNHLYRCPWCQSALEKDKEYFPLLGGQLRYKEDGEYISIDKEIRALIEGAAIDNVITPEEEKNIIKKARSLGYNKKEIERVKMVIEKKREEISSKSIFYKKEKEGKKVEEKVNIKLGIVISMILSFFAFYSFIDFYKFSTLQIIGLVISIIYFLGNISEKHRRTFFITSIMFFIITPHLFFIFLPIWLSYEYLNSLSPYTSNKNGLLIIVPFITSFFIYNFHGIIYNKKIPWPIYSGFSDKIVYTKQLNKKEVQYKNIKRNFYQLKGIWQGKNSILIIEQITKNGIIKGYIKRNNFFLKRINFKGVYYTKSSTFSAIVLNNKKKYGKLYGRIRNKILIIKYLYNGRIYGWKFIKK